MKSTSLIIYVILSIIFSCNPKGNIQEIYNTYIKTDSLEIETISGDCIIISEQIDSVHVRITHDYEPEGVFQPQFVKEGKKLLFKEEFKGPSNGSSKWTLRIPQNIFLNISSVSGNLKVTNHKSNLILTTISGVIMISNSEGSFSLETVSGEINGSNASGDFSIESVSGNLNFENTEVRENSRWSTVSGDNTISLAREPVGNMTISSISGNSLLNYSGNPISGYFEFIAEVDKGTIQSPIPFMSESTFTKDDKTFAKKSFQILKESPKIVLSTISGIAELREK